MKKNIYILGLIILLNSNLFSQSNGTRSSSDIFKTTQDAAELVKESQFTFPPIRSTRQIRTCLRHRLRPLRLPLGAC